MSADTTTPPDERPPWWRVRIPTSDFRFPQSPITVKRAKRFTWQVVKGFSSFKDAHAWTRPTRRRRGFYDQNLCRYLARISNLYGEEEAVKYVLKNLIAVGASRPGGNTLGGQHHVKVEELLPDDDR